MEIQRIKNRNISNKYFGTVEEDIDKVLSGELSASDYFLEHGKLPEQESIYGDKSEHYIERSTSSNSGTPSTEPNPPRTRKQIQKENGIEPTGEAKGLYKRESVGDTTSAKDPTTNPKETSPFNENSSTTRTRKEIQEANGIEPTGIGKGLYKREKVSDVISENVPNGTNNNKETTQNIPYEMPIEIGTFGKDGGSDGWNDSDHKPTTLSAVAAMTGLSVKEIAEYNHIENPDVIDAGSTILIPITFNVEVVNQEIGRINRFMHELENILTDFRNIFSKYAGENEELYTETLANKISEIISSYEKQFGLLNKDVENYIKWLNNAVESATNAMQESSGIAGEEGSTPQIM